MPTSNDTNPTSVFGNPLIDQVKNPLIGRTGADTPPNCYIRPTIPTTAAALGTVTATQGTWDDATVTQKYSYSYEFFESAGVTGNYKPMAIQLTATPKTSSGAAASTVVICKVKAINTVTGGCTEVWTNTCTVT